MLTLPPKKPQPLTVKRFGGIYANIAAGAESGWDFSSRWIVPDEVRSSLATNA